MAEKTFQQGVVEGRLQSLEKIVAERGVSIESLRADMNGMGVTIRDGIAESIGSLKNDISDEIALQIKPIALQADFACKELQGNGQPGLIKQFARSQAVAKVNWALTSSMTLTIIAIAMRVWIFVEPKV